MCLTAYKGYYKRFLSERYIKFFSKNFSQEKEFDIRLPIGIPKSELAEIPYIHNCLEMIIVIAISSKVVGYS
jgi:hypothetical protein